MHLYALPMLFILVGLAMYTVLGGADFGAGLWHLTAGNRPDASRINAATTSLRARSITAAS